MKKTLLTFCLLLFFSASVVSAQVRVHPKDLQGTWKMEINIDSEDLDDDEDSALGRIITNAVDGVLDEIDIYMEFNKNNELKTTVHAFGEKDVEYSEWHINDKGELILSDTEHVQSGDSIWMFDGKQLASYEYDRRGKLVKDSESVSIRRVKR